MNYRYLKITYLVPLLFVAVCAVGSFSIPDIANAAVISRPPNNLGLTGYWSFDEGRGTVAGDFSGQGNDGTFVGNPEWGEGRVGGAIDLSDDFSDYIKGTAPSLPNDFSVSFWLYTTEDWHGAWNLYLGTANFEVMGGWVFGRGNSDDPDRIIFHTADFSSRSSTNYYGLPMGEWVHVVGVYDNGTRSLYINADLKDSDVSSPYEENDMDLHIGSGVDSNGDVIRQSKSRLDDVRTYNRALSASEIKNLYNNSGQVVRNANRNDRYTNGLFGHWTFDASTVSGTDVEDVSGNDNDGTLHAPSLVGAGLLGQGLRTDTEVYPPFSHPLLTDDEWTASVWVNPATNEQDSGFRTVFGADSTAGVGSDRLFFDTGNQFRIRLNGTNTVFSPQAYFSGINKWNYVTLTKEFDGGSTYTYNIYINGEFKGTIDSSVGIFLDRFGASKSETGHRYVGKADDYRVYDRALSAEEVKGLYNATKPSTENANRNDLLTNGLVGHWSFDGPDVSASTADDVSGNGNDGTLNGDVSPAAGVIGQGFSFDGSGDYILVSPMDGLTNLTVSGWIYRENNSTWHALSSRQTGSNSTRNWWLGGESGQNKAFFSMYSSGGAANSHSSNGDLPQEEWTHITGTYNGSAMKIYINGALDKTIETSFTPVTSSADMAIGARGDGGTHYLDGLVDDVRIYNRALSADEVKRLYHMGR